MIELLDILAYMLLDTQLLELDKFGASCLQVESTT